MNSSYFWQPFEKVINNFDDLWVLINDLISSNLEENVALRRFAWRGQVDARWPLHHSLYRRLMIGKVTPLSEKDVQIEEDKILTNLHRWGLHAPAGKGRLSILNQLALMQHYGSPTRFIDITFNAWVAVWFAVEEKWVNGEISYEDCDGRLFIVDITDRLINEDDAKREWEDSLKRPWRDTFSDKNAMSDWCTSVYAWQPSSLDARIFAQNGGFLFGGIPLSHRNGRPIQVPKGPGKDSGWWDINEIRNACSLSLRPHCISNGAGRPSKSALYTIRIAAAAKKEIRMKLDKMFGYKHSTIYPDYTGFASFGTPEIRSH